MNQPIHLMTILTGCRETCICVTAALEEAGLSVQRTFDFEDSPAVSGACPNLQPEAHDRSSQLVIFLVYDTQGNWLTLTVQGNDRRTRLSLTTERKQPGETDLEKDLRQTLYAKLPIAVSAI